MAATLASEAEPTAAAAEPASSGLQQRYDSDARPTAAALRRRWVHLDCARRRAAQGGRLLKPPHCKHWLRRGACAFGDACFFIHDPQRGQQARARLQREAEAARKKAEARGRNRHGELLERRESAPRRGRRARVRNTHRASMLRRRIVALFGREALGGRRADGSEGTGVVLDVGGGKGELAFELTRLEHIPCCVIDPRPMRLHAYERRLQAGFYHRNRAFSADLPAATVDAATAAAAPLLRHMRALFQLPTPMALAQGAPAQPRALRDDEAWQRARRRAAKMVWDRKGLHEHEDEGESSGGGGGSSRGRGASAKPKLTAAEKTAKLRALQERRKRERQHWYEMHAGNSDAAALVAQRRQARQAKMEAMAEEEAKGSAMMEGMAAIFGSDSEAEADGDVAGGADAGDADAAGEKVETLKAADAAGACAAALDEDEGSEGGDGTRRAGALPAEATGEWGEHDADSSSESSDAHGEDRNNGGADMDGGDDDGDGDGDEDGESDGGDSDGDGAHSVGNLSWLADPALRTRVAQVHTLEEARAAVASAVALVGMHPDQGAEPLVDFALAHNLPFAVVVCGRKGGWAWFERLLLFPARPTVAV